MNNLEDPIFFGCQNLWSIYSEGLYISRDARTFAAATQSLSESEGFGIAAAKVLESNILGAAPKSELAFRPFLGFKS